MILNGSFLNRDIDYKFESYKQSFSLSKNIINKIKNSPVGDSLIVKYKEVPQWLTETFGFPLPELISPSHVSNESFPYSHNLKSYDKNNIIITGVKTFRVESQTKGNATFNQSLDLNISGNIDKKTVITGSISDRGYTPSYGTINNRISEFDKINLNVKSPAFYIQVGDFDWHPRQVFNDRLKKISGVLFELQKKSYHLGMVAARPRGRFESVYIRGINNKQGPYRINQNGSVLPVTSGSEEVWLDGKVQKRGANQDYIIDYVTGEVTFNANHIIDSRSRIEIDYEPLLTNYKGELLHTNGGVVLADSNLSVDFSWTREGDDKEQLLLGELSADDINLLSQIGDDEINSYRSGVNRTSGNYNLVIDSLPDSIYIFVGDSLGEYNISFSFVGSERGDYQFLGDNIYRYTGKNRGEYLPIVIISLPVRHDQKDFSVSFHNDLSGDYKINYSVTDFDKNLYSDLNDEDNSGELFSFENRKDWQREGADNYIDFKIQKKEKNYITNQRLYQSDFRRMYYFPDNFNSKTDENYAAIATRYNITGNNAIDVKFSRLDFVNSFESDFSQIGVVLEPYNSFTIISKYGRVDAKFISSGQKLSGEVENYWNELSYKFFKNYVLKLNWEYDARENKYLQIQNGTRFNRVSTIIQNNYNKFIYEKYNEDSLNIVWNEIFSRDRFTLNSVRAIRNLKLNSTFSYEHSKFAGDTENSILARVNYNYKNRAQKYYISGFYTLSDETRNARGITYLKVEPGQGNFILEGNDYIPDPSGNYIQVEEILSGASRVKRGAKNFQYRLNRKIFRLKLSSVIEEELLPDGQRKISWLIPFYSDKNQSYQFYSRQYHGDLRLFRIKNSHRLILDFVENRESRNIVDVPKEKFEIRYKLTMQHIIKKYYINLSYEDFEIKRDSYYSIDGVVEGYKLSSGIKYLNSLFEQNLNIFYRFAKEVLGENSKQYSVKGNNKLRFKSRGEIVSSVELYKQSLSENNFENNYLLTDNRPGDRGAIWSVGFNYNLKKQFRMNLSLGGKHANNIKPRITARTEIIAGF